MYMYVIIEHFPTQIACIYLYQRTKQNAIACNITQIANLASQSRYSSRLGYIVRDGCVISYIYIYFPSVTLKKEYYSRHRISSSISINKKVIEIYSYRYI